MPIIHPNDENPLKATTSQDPHQFRYGIQYVSTDQYSVGIAFRNLTSIQQYDNQIIIDD